MSGPARDIAPELPLNPETQLYRLIERYYAGIRERNADQVVACYAPGSIMFTLAPPLRFTPESSPGIKGVREWMGSFRGPIQVERRELRILADENVAFSHSLNHMTAEKLDGERVDFWYRETLGFVRYGNEWRIAHQHNSVPFHMDGSLRAAVDLLP